MYVERIDPMPIRGSMLFVSSGIATTSSASGSLPAASAATGSMGPRVATASAMSAVAKSVSTRVIGQSRPVFSSVRRGQGENRQCRRRIGHEHPAQRLALVATVLAVVVQRVGPPRAVGLRFGLHVVLVGPEPVQDRKSVV